MFIRIKRPNTPIIYLEKEVRKRIGIGDGGTIDTMPGGFLTSKKRAGYLRWLAGIEEGSIHLIEENGHISYGWDDDYQGDLWPNARIMKTILGEADTQLDITDKRYNEKIISEKEYSLTSEEVYERNTEWKGLQ